jgi:PIN domain nuclease of toxin-antitoxin system
LLAERRNHFSQRRFRLGNRALADTARIILDISADVWIERFLKRPGVGAVPLTHSAAIRAYRLHDLEHRDPADRFLIATAIELGCPLVTYDERIAAFGQRHGAQYLFMVEA